MLIIHRNCIAYDNLNEEDLAEIQDPVMSHDDGYCWHEILDGDESIQRSIGDSYTWKDLLNADYKSGSDVIIAPTVLRETILPDLKRIGFKVQGSYFADEDRYHFKGNEAHYLKPGRPVGFSPINGVGGAMVKKTKAWSMPEDDWEWLESQSNQSDTIRKAIALLRENQL